MHTAYVLRVAPPPASVVMSADAVQQALEAADQVDAASEATEEPDVSEAEEPAPAPAAAAAAPGVSEVPKASEAPAIPLSAAVPSRPPKKARPATGGAVLGIPRRRRRVRPWTLGDCARGLGRRPVLRMAIRAGAGRVQSDFHHSVFSVITAVAMDVMRISTAMANHANRRTICLRDVANAIEYGFRRRIYHGQ